MDRDRAEAGSAARAAVGGARPRPAGHVPQDGLQGSPCTCCSKAPTSCTTVIVPPGAPEISTRSSWRLGTPVLLIIGSPMGASGFVTLASHFTDRTVVTYDPRGADRSRRTDGAAETTPDEHADDLHRLISRWTPGPWTSSPAAAAPSTRWPWWPSIPSRSGRWWPRAAASAELPDREVVLAACVDIHETYQRSGFGPAMAKFIGWSATKESCRPVTPTSPPRTPPCWVSGRGRRLPERPSRRADIVTCNTYQHDFDALRAGSTRVVIGVGATSGQMIAGRAAAVAERLGCPPSPSPAATTGSSAANTAAWASPTPSPPPCTRSSTTNGRVARGVGRGLQPRRPQDGKPT